MFERATSVPLMYTTAPSSRTRCISSDCTERRVGEVERGPEVRGDVLLGRVGTEADRGRFVTVAVSEQRRTTCPRRVVEAWRPPCGALVRSVVEVAPDRTGRDQRRRRGRRRRGDRQRRRSRRRQVRGVDRHHGVRVARLLREPGVVERRRRRAADQHVVPVDVVVVDADVVTSTRPTRSPRSCRSASVPPTDPAATAAVTSGVLAVTRSTDPTCCSRRRPRPPCTCTGGRR